MTRFERSSKAVATSANCGFTPVTRLEYELPESFLSSPGIRKELNLTASAGVAPNKFVAKLASDWKKPDGLFVIQPEEIDAFLLPLSIGRLPGVGKVKGDRLAKLGVKTVRQLRRELSKLEK